MMRDILKHCITCKHDHLVGQLGVDQQNVPLYGARKCRVRIRPKGKKPWPHPGNWKVCGCNKFVEDEKRFKRERIERLTSSLPVVKNMTREQVLKMYNETGFLSPQSEPAARIAIYKLLQMPKGNERDKQFMIAMLGSTYDTRAAFVRTDSKFANLVASADDLLRSMQGVAQLKEQLANNYAIQERILEAMDGLAERLDRLAPPPTDANPIFDGALVCQRCQHLKDEHTDGLMWCRNTTSVPACECDAFTLSVSVQQAAHTFASKSAPLWNEPIPADSEPTDD